MKRQETLAVHELIVHPLCCSKIFSKMFIKKTEFAAPLWSMPGLCRRQGPARLSTWLDINYGIDHSRGMKWDTNINKKRCLHLDYMIFIP